jgi:putative ABC transport system permease protein
MKVIEALALAISGISANRLRSALTMLGILIGVGAVILLVAVGNGASVSVQNQIQSLGANIIYVYPASTRAGGVSQGFGTAQTLSQNDVNALNDKSQAPDIVTAIPIASSFGNIVYHTGLSVGPQLRHRRGLDVHGPGQRRRRQGGRPRRDGRGQPVQR